MNNISLFRIGEDALLVVLAFSFLLLYSCGGADPNDRSLSMQEYRKIGMPDPDRMWQTNDVALALAVLENLHSGNPEQLPLMDSKKSGKIFDQMLSQDNLKVLSDSQLPGEQRLSIANSLLNNCENWFRIYARSPQLKAYYQDELAAILLYGMDITEQMMDIVEDLAGGPVDDEELTEKVRLRYLAGLFNILREQNNASYFSKKNLRKISEYIVESVNKNKEWMDEATIDELKRVLRNLVERQSDQRIIEEYTALLDKL